MRREYDEIPKILFDSLCITRIGMMSSQTKAHLFEQEIKKKNNNFDNI